MIELRKLEVLGVKVNHRGDWLFVRAETRDGHTGYGEVSHSGNDRAVARLLTERVASVLVGRPFESVGSALEVVEAELANNGASLRLNRTALSGTEHALWDVFARRLQVPVHALLGGARRRRIPLYANINRALADRSAEAFADAARRAVADGFRAIKIAPFDGLSWQLGNPTEIERLLALGIERTAAVRRAIGDQVGLMVDCHGRFNRELALQVSRRLEPFRLAWLEDLIWRADDPEALADLAPQIEQSLAGGEEELERRGIWQLLSNSSVSTILPDVKHVGGLAEAKRIAELAELHRVWVAPHNPAGPIATRVSAELSATLPNLSHLEFAWGEADFRSQLLDPPERIVEGHLELPSGPGYGVALNERVLREHAFDPVG